MRVTLYALAGLALGAGVSMTSGRPPSVDMVSARYSSTIPNPTHLGHWEAPAQGRPVFITPNMMEAGTGSGSVTFGVTVDGVGTICSMSAPCTAGPLSFHTAACQETSIAPGAAVHLAFSHTCDTPPTGNVIFGFEWAR